MRRLVLISVSLVLIVFFAGADVSYAGLDWRVTGLYVPGSSSGTVQFLFNVPNTEWGLTTSAHAGGYASLMYLHNYHKNGVPLTLNNVPVIRDTEFYCQDFYSGCTGLLEVPSSVTASGVFAGGTYLAWVHTGSEQNEVSSVYLDKHKWPVSFNVPSTADSDATIDITWTNYLQRKVSYYWRADIEAVYYAWYGQTGWRQKTINNGHVYITGDDYKIDDNTRVGSGHLLLLFFVDYEWYEGYDIGHAYGYFMRDVWVGNYNVGSVLSGGVVEMPGEGYVDITYTGGWYPVGVPTYMGYTCNWTELPSFLTARGTGNCQVSGVPTAEGLYSWRLTVTASNNEMVTYSGKISIKKFEDVITRPGGSGLATWIIGLTNISSTGIGSIVMTLDHVRVVFTNAVKSLNVTVDDSLSTFDTSKISDFVGYGKGLLPPGAALPISAWIAVTGIDVVLSFVGIVKGVIKWW